MGGSNEASLNQGSMGNVGFDDRTPEKWARFKKKIIGINGWWKLDFDYLIWVMLNMIWKESSEGIFTSCSHYYKEKIQPLHLLTQIQLLHFLTC